MARRDRPKPADVCILAQETVEKGRAEETVDVGIVARPIRWDKEEITEEEDLLEVLEEKRSVRGSGGIARPTGNWAK